MSDQRAKMGEIDDSPDGCSHYWLIEAPAGETSEGRCKHCGAIRTFYNSSQTRPLTRAAKIPAPQVRV